MRFTRRTFAAAGGAALCALALLPAGAQAQAGAIQAIPCPSPEADITSATCGRLRVPLDHSGRIPGTQVVTFARIPARGRRLGVVAVIPGGPGQTILDLGDTLEAVFGTVVRNHDLLLVDPRGTGLSDPTGCKDPGGFADPAVLRAVAACARHLGARRATLTSGEQAHDLDDVRAALGLPSLTVLGVSYGTKVAAEYARRFPASTDHVVLDSPVPFDGLDGTLELPTLGIPRTLREVCWPPGCVGISHDADPEQTIGRLVARLQRAPLRTVVVDGDGTRHRVAFTTRLLYLLLVTSDLDPLRRVALPAAIRSGNNGDGAYLARLAGGGDPTGDGADPFAADAPSADDSGRFVATTCLESRLPWRPDAPLAGRAEALRAVVAAHAARYVPFPPALVASMSDAASCVAWPPTPAPDPVPVMAPPVPTLVLSGREDLRTPTEDARRTAATYPVVRLLTVPSVGHSVLTTDLSGCAMRGLVAFLANAPVKNCAPGGLRLLGPRPFIPANLASFPTRAGLRGRAGRTVAAVGVTLSDALLQAALAGGSDTGGLRRGTARFARERLTLDRYETVRGVDVSGLLDVGATPSVARLTVTGPAAARGTLILRGNRVAGVLGGRRFSVVVGR